MNENVLMALMTIGITVLVWIILRPLVLWYFKINTIIDELKENNRLLALGKDSYAEEEKPEPEETSEWIDTEAFHELRKKLKNNQLIVQTKKTGKLQIIDKADWEDIVKIGNESMFEVYSEE